MEENNKKRNIGIVLGLIILLVMVIGVTYAAFQYTKSGTRDNQITTGTISFKYNETSNGITLSNATPTPDSEGKKLQKGDVDNGYFDFNVDSHLGADTEVQYFVYAVDVTGDIENKLDPKYVKVYLTDQSSPENPYEGYDEEVPVYSALDDVTAQTSDKQQVTGKLLYQNKFTSSGTHFYRLRLWVSDEYDDNEVSRTFKMRVDVNTDAEITPSDKEKPTCTIENAQPKKASKDEDITMTIKCSDNNGVVTSNMTSENIHVKQNGSEIQPTKKELGAGTATASVTGNNGVQHTLTLSGFESEGDISISIDPGVITDKKGNTNDEINLETGVSISKRVTVTLANGGGVTSFGEQDKLTCDLKDSKTCNVTLPEITKAEGYTGSFWAEEETAHEGKQPGSIEVSNDTTYYAIGEKEVNVTFTPKEGVESVGKESDTCKYYGKETSCEIALPEITAKEGYENSYWGANDNTEYVDRIQEEKVSVTDNTTYYAFAKDVTGPVCTLEEYFPTKTITKDKTVELTISCTDESEITQDLTEEGIKITVGDEEESELTKEITKTESIEKGKKYTVEVKGFTKTGKIGATINEGALQDSLQNPNKETPLEIELEIANKEQSPEDLIDESNPSDTEYSDATKDKLFEISQPDGSTGYRYIGNTEKNYVNLLGTDDGKTDANLWRIIGVFEEENASGVKEKRIKLILNERLNNTNYAWDNNGSNGSNNWARPAALNSILNGAFWNASSGSCPSGANGATTSCSFTSYKMNTVQSKIETMKWHLGGNAASGGTEKYFTDERGSAVPSGASATYNGNVGLMYPSDYGYTYAKGVSDTCYGNLYGNSSCNSTEGAKSWMWKSAYPQWTITPLSGLTYGVFSVGYGSYAYVLHDYALNALGVRPVVYLKSNIGITGGNGTKDEPYTVGEKTVADLDTTSPTCSITSITPESPTTEDSVQIKIKCTDDSGKVKLKSPLTKEEIEVKLNGEETSATKELSSASEKENEIEYTLTLNNFDKPGSLSLTIPEGKVTDESGNVNIKTSLTAGVITGKPTEQNGLPSNGAGTPYSDATKDKMFEFTHDGHTEYRYIGNTEKNYVNLLGTDDGKTDANLWRIIGVFDDPSAAEGTTGKKKIKLILDEKLNNTNYSWDNNGQYGSNNWNRPAALKTALNQTFWNSTSGTCPYNNNGGTTACDFTSYKIKSVQDKIENMKWYLGAVDGSYGSYSAQKFYQLERGSTAAGAGGGTSATGQVGLAYPSDYGYTFANGVDSKCHSTPYSCNSGTPSKSWMYKSGYHWWTLTSLSGYAYSVYFVRSNGSVNSTGRASDTLEVHPVVYLKSNIGITGGKGTKTEPYTVG